MSDTRPSDNSECGVCTSPTGDAGRLCRIHTDDLAAELACIPELVKELEVAITRQSRTVAERHGGRSAERPLPWNEYASGRAFELNATVNAWALDVDRLGHTDSRDPLRPIHHADTAAVAGWLVRNLPQLRQHPDAGQAHEELIDSVRQARRAIDRPLDKLFAGPCNTPDEDTDQTCMADLYGLPGKTVIYCPACGARHVMAERREWMLSQIEDQVTHSGLLSGLVSGLGVAIASSTIRRYASQGRIHAVSVDAKNRRLYRIGDVLDVFLKRAA